MNLEIREKERIKAYKNYLRDEADKQTMQRKEQNNYDNKKKRSNVNEIVQLLDERDMRRLQQRKKNAIMLKEHNNGQFMSLQNSNPEVMSYEEQKFQNNGSFVDYLNQRDEQRIGKNKLRFESQKQQNAVENHEKRLREIMEKNSSREQEQKHLNQLSQMERQYRQKYDNLLKKHGQDMSLYQRHEQLQEQNHVHRRVAQKFTECEEDIISRLKRNQSEERKRRLIQNQKILKSQMSQIYQRRSQQKQRVRQAEDVDSSIFKNLLHGSPNNKKEYGNQLREQIIETSTKKIQEKMALKSPYRIQGVYGGQHSRQRQQQIKYIDRKMGIESDYGEKNINQINKLSSSLVLQKQKMIKNSQEIIKKDKIKNLSISYREPSNMNQIEQKNQERLHHTSFNEKRDEQPIQYSAHADAPKMNLSIALEKKPKENLNNMVQNIYSQKFQNVHFDQRNRYNEPKQLTPIAAGDPGMLYHQQRQGDRKIFRSFDLLTGRNKFYG